MITSTLSQLHWYKNISPHFEKAIEYALRTDFTSLEAGKYEIDGNRAFALVNEYTTKNRSECDPESHRLYADIQIMVAGVEKFGFTPWTNEEPTTAYNPEKDLALYTLGEETLSYITLRAGQFIVFFPSDIHQPEVCHGEPEPVKKVVLKIAVR
jgi:YhcH/YjgK/YiaL family protein